MNLTMKFKESPAMGDTNTDATRPGQGSVAAMTIPVGQQLIHRPDGQTIKPVSNIQLPVLW